MTRLAFVEAASLALLLCAAGCADTTQIDNKPVAAVSEATPAPEVPTEAPAPVPAGDVFTVDAATSTIGFLGAKVTKSHKGGFSQFTGEAVVSNGAPVSTKFEVQVASLWAEEKEPAEGTGAWKLTNHLKSPDFFDVANFPTATFASTKIEAAGAPNAYTMTGDLTMAGITKVVTFPASIEIGADAVNTKADFQINRKDWAIVYPGAPDDLIKDEVALSLVLSFRK